MGGRRCARRGCGRAVLGTNSVRATAGHPSHSRSSAAFRRRPYLTWGARQTWGRRCNVWSIPPCTPRVRKAEARRRSRSGSVGLRTRAGTPFTTGCADRRPPPPGGPSAAPPSSLCVLRVFVVQTSGDSGTCIASHRAHGGSLRQIPSRVCVAPTRAGSHRRQSEAPFLPAACGFPHGPTVPNGQSPRPSALGVLSGSSEPAQRGNGRENLRFRASLLKCTQPVTTE